MDPIFLIDESFPAVSKKRSCYKKVSFTKFTNFLVKFSKK